MWYFDSPHVIFGEEALSYLAQLSGRRAFVITDQNIARLGVAQLVIDRVTEAGLACTGEYLLDLTWTLTASHGDVLFASDEVHYAWPYLRLDPAFSGDQGGKIISDTGAGGQEATNLKPALWIDYSNAVGGTAEAVALFQWPDGKERRWLTREYGTFGPRRPDDLSDKPFTLKKAEAVSQRVGVLVHRGDVEGGRVPGAVREVHQRPLEITAAGRRSLPTRRSGRPSNWVKAGEWPLWTTARSSKRFIDQIQVEVDALSQKVTELLELSRIESGKFSLEFRPVSPRTLLDSAGKRMRLQAERAGLGLHVECAEDLPEVQMDIQRMEQVLANLIHNAVKFTPPGGEILLFAEAGAGEVQFAVRDSRIGIPAEEVSRVFERFYRVDKSRTGSGTGLGLSIAEHIVEAHEGRIWAESIEGQGSTFIFTLPFS